MQEQPHNFSKILVVLMKEHNMTVKRAAEIAGVGSSTVQAWRSGTKPTDFQAIRKLAHALGVSFSYLLTGIDDASMTNSPHAEKNGVKSDDIIFDGFARITIRESQPESRTTVSSVSIIKTDYQNSDRKN